MSINSSSYSNTIIKNNNNNNSSLNSQITNNLNKKQNSFSDFSQISNYCNNISEINNQNENGYTPIYLTILSNNIQALKELLTLGADLNIPNNLNETPLYLSIKINNFDAFLILLKYNADCNIQNIKGDIPLHLAIQKKEKKFIEMLLKNNSNPNIQNFTLGQTPVHLAIINKLDEEILKLIKKSKGNIFHIKDKLNKTPFDYAKEFNDENYLNMLLKIFGYNHSTINNGLDEINNNSIDEINICPPKKENTALNKCTYNINTFPEKEIKEFSHSNTNSNNINIVDYYMITSETNKNEFKIDNCESNKDKAISNNSLAVNKIILSSDMSSENIQIKELNSSIDNIPCKIKKSLSEFIPEEKVNKINIKDKLDINNNISNQINNKNGISSNLPKTKSHRFFGRNSDNTKTKSNMINTHSNSSNNYENQSQNSVSNSYNNIFMTNSVGANKKIIKNIIRDTIKKILVKSISSSDENTSNLNCLSKESEKLSYSNLDDSKKTKNTNPLNTNQNNIINSNNNTNNILNQISNKDPEKIIIEKNILNNNDTKNINNLYENGTSSYYLINTNKVSEIMNDDNITISKLIPTESKTINLFENVKKENNKQNNDTELKESENNDSKVNKMSETSNSNIFSDLQIKSNNNEEMSNNDISLSYSKNLQNEEDEIQFKLIENKLDKKLQEIKNENNLELNLDNSNLDIKIYDNQSNLYSKNSKKNNMKKIDSKLSENDLNELHIIQNLNDDSHKKKKSNGNINNTNKHSELCLDSFKIDGTKFNYKLKTLNNNTSDNYLEANEDLNGVSKKKIFKKSRLDNKSQVYLNRRKQLSYHLNINSKKEKEENNNKYLDEIFLNNKSNTINVIENKENDNPNKISINNQKIYKNKNNIKGGWYNINSNKSIKYSTNSKSTNKFLVTNRGSKISLTKSGSCHNMNPPPIGGYYIRDGAFSPSNNSIASINNLYIRNSSSNNNKSIKHKSPNNYNTLMNNTDLATNKPKHSSLNKAENNNKNIPNKINNNYINPYYKNSDSYKNRDKLINNNFDSEESSNNLNNKLKNISTEELLKLRDFLISCDLLCYYNLLISKDMYHIDLYTKNLQQKLRSISYEDLEEIGIKKPGHIYRILLKLEIDAGLINNDLFNYIIDKINFNSVTSTLAMTSSVNGIFCCGINLCPNDNANNRNKLRHNSIYFNDLNSFLRVNDIVRLKGNFIHNGFDRIEYVIIQQFSKYAFDKKILNEYLHIYIDKDKNKLLNILQMIKNNLSNEFGINFEIKDDIKENNTDQKPAYEVYEFSDNKNKSDDKNNNINDDIINEINDNKENKSDNNHYCNIF